MNQEELRFRQIHLDFHTSEKIPSVGADFDPKRFADTLARAHVNSVTCFARGHHGWLYYDSEEFPERVHPNLERKDLLKEQIEACHRRDINVPVYVTVQWDHYTATRHPQWRVVTPQGKLSGTPPYEAGFYGDLCVNTPYRDFLKRGTREVLKNLPVDGIFFDIVQIKDCSCRYCREGMEKEGLDPSAKEDRLLYAKNTLDGFKEEMTEFVKSFDRDCTVFYNGGHVGPYLRESADAYTHFELESLPSGGWGYTHFPLSVRYARTLGKDCLGMTGKFHTSWGDFHSFKTEEALQFECFRMLALNAKCSVGDQLPPEGKLSEPVYDLVGSVYEEVEEKEPWCKGARPLTDLAVISPEERTGERVPSSAAGAVKMLEEGSHQFDVLDSSGNFSDYKLLILPDEVRVSAETAEKIEKFLARGGKLIASALSGLNPEGEKFLPSLGVRLDEEIDSIEEIREIDEKASETDYILPREDSLGEGLPQTEHAMYMRALKVKADEEAEILADVVSSYFDRTWEHFCSHRQTPSSGQVAGPATVRRENCIYFAHPLFSQYNKNAPRWCKQLLLNGLDLLLEEPLLKHDGPSTLRTAVNAQEEEDRQVIHLLHYIPERRGEDFDVIQDVIPLREVEVSLRTEREVESVRSVPEGGKLDFIQQGGRTDFQLPKLEGHEMVEVKFIS